MKKVGTKIGWIVATFIILESMLIACIVSLETFGNYRLDLDLDVLTSELVYTFTNIPSVAMEWWEVRNPFFILGTIAILFYSIYLQLSNKDKRNGWETEDELGYHGTARWARYKEIFDKKNFIPKTKKDIQNEFLKSIEKGE